MCSLCKMTLKRFWLTERSMVLTVELCTLNFRARAQFLRRKSLENNSNDFLWKDTYFVTAIRWQLTTYEISNFLELHHFTSRILVHIRKNNLSPQKICLLKM